MKAELRLPQFRVTLNSRCQRACFYCRPSGEGLSTPAHTEVPIDSLITIGKQISKIGIRQIKLTGGDPALYSDLETGVQRLRDEAGFTEIELISRHPKIGPRAQKLAENGVTIFNMSIDTLDPSLHKKVTGKDDLSELLQALDQCIETGVPCKVNVVVMNQVNYDEIESLIDTLSKRGVKYIKLLDVITDLDEGNESFRKRLNKFGHEKVENLYAPLHEISEKLRATAISSEVKTQGDFGHPMTILHMPSGCEVVFKDSHAGAWYGTPCKSCKFYPCHDALMALRLTADMRLQLCLLNEEVAISLADVIDTPDVLEARIKMALKNFDNASFVKSVDQNEAT